MKFRMEAFKFKKFSVQHSASAMKVGSDGILLGAWSNIDDCQKILDIGTGTGLIALMLAQRNTTAKIFGVEIDKGSYGEACLNVKESPFSSRVSIEHQSIQEFALATTAEFDLIVCNPPFFTGGTMSSQMKRNVIRHTIKLPHNELLIAVKSLLSRAGNFELILPMLEGLRFIELASSYGLYLHRFMEVKPKYGKQIKRLLLSFQQQIPGRVEWRSLVMRQGDLYSSEYKDLTRDFYLFIN